MGKSNNSVNVEIRADVKGKESLVDFTNRLDQMAGVVGGDLQKALQQASAKLKELAAQDGAIKAFNEVKREATDAAAALKRAEAEAASFGRQITAVGAPTAQEAAQLLKLQAAAEQARQKLQQKTEVLSRATGTLQQYGIAADATKAAEQRLAAQVQQVTSNVTAMVPALQQAGGAGKAGGEQIHQSMKGAGDAITTAKNELLAFAGVTALGQSLKDVAAVADQWKNVQARLQLALGAQTDITKAMADVETVAKDTFTALEETATLYARIATAGKDMGLSQQQALATTKTINQAIQLSGASAEASKAAVTQLIQGLQSGVLRGEEFNSVMEQAPRLSKALADGLGVTIGQLRAMAEAGKLSSDTVIRALQGQAATINKEFSALPITIGRAVQNLQTEWMKFVGTLDGSHGATASVAAGIDSLSRHLDDLARIATATGAALVASYAIQGVQALKVFAAEMAATGGVAALLQTNLAKLSRPVQIAIAVTGFEVGFQIGDMLQSNYAWARKLGVGIVAFFEQTVAGLVLLKDAALAIFTDDTVGAAFDRWKQRARDTADITGQLWSDADKARQAVGASADDAAAKTKELGSVGQQAGTAVAAGGAAGAAGVGQIGAAAASARDTLEALAQSFNQRIQTDKGVGAIAEQLKAARDRGVDLDRLLRTQLPEALSKLNGGELAKFRADFERAMAEAGLKGQELRTGLRLIGEQAAQNLGVDVPLAMNKVSESFRQSQDDLAVLVRSLPQLKAQGVDTAGVLAQAFAKMIDGAKSNAELDAVRGRIQALRKELGEPLANGLLDQAKDKAIELKNKLDDLKPGINSLDEAMRKLGLQTSASLRLAADEAVKSFDVIKQAGQQEGESYVAWQARKEAAAKVMIQRLIDANGGVANEAIKARAAIEGLIVSSDDAGNAVVSSMGRARDAINAVGDAARRTAAAVNGISGLSGKNDLGLDANGRTAYQRDLLGKQTGPVDNTYIFQLRERLERGETFAPSEAAAIRNALRAAEANNALSWGNANVSLEGQRDAAAWVAVLQQALEKATSPLMAGTVNGNGFGSGGGMPSTPVGAGNSAAGTPLLGPSYTTVVNIGGQSTSINTASEADNAALAELLRKLSGDKGRT